MVGFCARICSKIFLSTTAVSAVYTNWIGFTTASFAFFFFSYNEQICTSAKHSRWGSHHHGYMLISFSNFIF